MKSAFLPLGLMIPFFLVIAGCGGGGGSKKPSPTPTTSSPVNSGVTTSSSNSISSAVASSSIASSAPPTQQLSMHGKVAASALSGGEVVFTIGTQTFKAPINSAGDYEIALPLSTVDQQKPFVAIATGSGSNAWVQLAAYFPPVRTLVEKAGDDKHLNAAEFFGVNITPLSTALYAEIITINNNSAPETEDQLRNALMGIQSVRPLEGAGLILRLLSDVNFKLPAPAATTLEFLSDANLFETYKEISGLIQRDWIKTPVARMQSDSAQTYIPAQVSGDYYLETKNSSRYVISFYANGTGRLTTGNLDADYVFPRSNYAVTSGFTWQQSDKKVTITFDAPVSYAVDTLRIPDKFYSCDITATAQVGEVCDLQFKSIELDLIAASETNMFATLRLLGTALNAVNAEVLNGQISEHIAQLTSFNNTPEIDTNALIDHEWYTGEFSYLFNIDGTARITKLVDSTSTIVEWRYQRGQINVGSTNLWVINNHTAGYVVAEVVDSKVAKSILVKRTPVTMSEADWVGRWIGYPHNVNTLAYDVNADKTWSSGFEASFTGGWNSLDNRRQVSISNRVKRIRDVLAIHNQQYYLSICQGEDKPAFVAERCNLAVLTKSENFDGGVFWEGSSYSAFNETGTGTPWISIGTATFFGTDASAMNVIDGIRVSENKMFYPDSNTIMEMTFASRNEMALCEYPLFGTCALANKKTYERGVQVKLPQGAALLFYAGYDSGSFYNAQPYLINAFIIPKNLTVQTLIFSQVAGRKVESVSGCDGTLQNQQYVIPARSTDCELSVTFLSIP